MPLNYIKPEKLWLKDHPDFDEAWLRDRIKDDPSILGLGDLEIRAVEKVLPKAGRLDLLMYDPETDQRFEIELMLGTVDESHIIRCIEYWDIERKRYPRYEHTAVLIAENITSRFLNVISLFNGSIPLIAIQLNALKVNDHIALDFVTVLNEVVPGDEEEDEESAEAVDRLYWENKTSKESLDTADKCMEIIREFAPTVNLSYLKDYLGLKDKLRPQNFVIFVPKRHFVRVEVKITDQQPWRQRLEDAGVVLVTGAKEDRRIKFRLKAEEVEKHRPLLKELFQAGHHDFQG